MKKDKEYYFIDIDLRDMRVVEWGVSSTASLTGSTGDPIIHRIYLPKGQFNKFVRHVE